MGSRFVLKQNKAVFANGCHRSSAITYLDCPVDKTLRPVRLIKEFFDRGHGCPSCGLVHVVIGGTRMARDVSHLFREVRDQVQYGVIPIRIRNHQDQPCFRPAQRYVDNVTLGL